MTNTKPKFPEYIDNSMRSAFVKCPENWARAYLSNLEPKGGSIHLVAGKAFARGLEVARRKFFDENETSDMAIVAGIIAMREEFGTFEVPERFTQKGPDNLAKAIVDYFDEYPLEPNPIKPHRLANGKSCVEFSFALPLEINHPETGNPLLYAGRFDMLAEYQDTLFAVDEKTASQLGQQWANNWDLDSQFTGYIWAARQYGYPVSGAVIRGVSLLKTGFGHAQHIIYRNDFHFDQWLDNLYDNIENMIRYWNRGWFPKALDKSACNSYGGCSFRKLCSSPNPDAWIAMDYEPRTWSPLNH